MNCNSHQCFRVVNTTIQAWGEVLRKANKSYLKLGSALSLDSRVEKAQILPCTNSKPYITIPKYA